MTFQSNLQSSFLPEHCTFQLRTGHNAGFSTAALPPELKLRIFDILPARNIARCRRVCKELQVFVDINVTAQRCIRERQKINADVDRNVYFVDCK
jgi:hypothetical protein